MGIRTEMALATTIAATAAAFELPNVDPASVAQAQTQGQTAPDPELLSFCLKEAVGVETDAQLAAVNPAEFVTSRYLGRSLRRFGASAVANEISPDCADVVTGRRFTIDQIYKGRNNMPRNAAGEPMSIVIDGLGRMTGQPLIERRLRVPFTGIKGPAVRAYKIRATETVTTTGGTFSYTGTDTVRGATDGV